MVFVDVSTQRAKHAVILIKLLTGERVRPAVPQSEQLLVEDRWRTLPLALEEAADVEEGIC